MKPKVLAIVPARANSKRIPGKNKKNFLGKPLIQWSIEAALQSECVTDTVVSTDDLDILDYQKKYPNIKFVKRPDHLALDTTSGVAPVLDLLQSQFSGYDYVILLQPTSPLRTSKHVDDAFNELIKSKKTQLVSVKPVSDVLSHAVVKNGEEVSFLKERVTDLPEQSLIKVLNGALYITDVKTLLKTEKFMGNDVLLFEMDEFVSVDIDLPNDWQKAELFGKMKEL